MERFSAAGGLLVFVWFLVMLGAVVSWVFLITAAWRAMKAHESIAATMTELVEAMKRRGPGDWRRSPTPTRTKPDGAGPDEW